MDGFDFLNLVIGLIFIYLIYSIAASVIWELMANLSQLRGKMLMKWLGDNFKGLLVDENNNLHALFKGLSKNGKKPNYISAEVFGDALFEVLMGDNFDSVTKGHIIGADGKINVTAFQNKLNALNVNEDLQKILMNYVRELSFVSKVKEKLGRWYDEAQEELIGSFKKHLQRWILLISTVLVVSTNADTVRLATYLYNNPDASKSIADNVDKYLKDSTLNAYMERKDPKAPEPLATSEQNLSEENTDSTVTKETHEIAKDSTTQRTQEEIVKDMEKNMEELRELSTMMKNTELPLGWTNQKWPEGKTFWAILKKIGGLLLTIFAVSLGSPFWFDVLNKLSNLRSSGAKPKKTEE